MSCPFTGIRVRAIALAAASLVMLLTMAVAPASAQCSSPDVGRWINTNAAGDPAQIEIYFAECGDTAGATTRIGVKVFVKQSTGALYQRPAVKASRVVDKNVHYLFAQVPTGGYVDKMWMRRIRKDNQELLRVVIRHQSLDSKPSASSTYDYRRR